MTHPIAKSPLSDARARPILEKAVAKVESLGGVDATFKEYQDKKAGGITADGIDRFLSEADVGMFTRAVATGKVHSAMDADGDSVISKAELRKSWELMQALNLRP